MRSRENGWDLMRVIAAVFVVFAHSAALTVKNAPAPDMAAILAYMVFMILAKVSVIFFFMVSGAFVLSSSRTLDLKAFYKGMLKRIVLPAAVFSVVYFVLDIVMTLKAGGKISSVFLVFVTAKGYGTHLWFMVVLTALYLAAPLIRLLKDKISLRAFTLTALALILLGFLGESTSPHYFVFDPGFAVGNLGVFMLGYSVYEKFREKKSAFRGILLLAFSALAVAGLTFLILKRVCVDVPVLCDLFRVADHNLIIILIAASVTVGMLMLPVRKDFSKAGALTYGVYLVHALFIFVFQLTLCAVKGVHYSQSVLSVPEALVLAAAVCAVSFLLTALYYRLVRKKVQKK